MNLFTRFLRQWSQDDDFAAFVAYWDRLEQLTVLVYRKEISLAEAQQEFETVWPWLRRRYGRWQPALEPYWRQTHAAGAPTATDPFLLLLNLPSPAAIRANWHAMQHLPAAREALNQYLLNE